MSRARVEFPINRDGRRVCDSLQDAEQALRDAYEAVAAAKAYAGVYGSDEVHERLRAPKGQLLAILNLKRIGLGRYEAVGS